jgi:hypothetical protein
MKLLGCMIMWWGLRYQAELGGCPLLHKAAGALPHGNACCVVLCCGPHSCRQQ